MMYTFGQPGDPRAVKRRIRIEARGNRFEVAALEFESGETVEFEFRNLDSRPHELRIGDPRYQQAMLECCFVIAAYVVKPRTKPVLHDAADDL